MARGIDDVDGPIAPLDSGVLGEDGDPLFALEIHRIHDPIVAFALLFMGSESAGLPEHGIDQCGLAMVYVSDDGDIPQIIAFIRITQDIPISSGSRVGSKEWVCRIAT